MTKIPYIPYEPALTLLARENRNNPTAAELKMWHEVLRKKQLANFKFIRQKPIRNFIVDFYCSELRLVLEIDGDSHAESVEYDARRTRVLNALGLDVLRYTNHDVLHNIEGVYQNLLLWLTKITPLDPPLSGGKRGSISD